MDWEYREVPESGFPGGWAIVLAPESDQRIVLNKQTHNLRLEGDGEDEVTLVVEPKPKENI